MNQISRSILGVAIMAALSLGQSVDEVTSPDLEGPAQAEAPVPSVVVPAGTRVPLVMINSISSKHSRPGDRVYLESVYPVLVDGRVTIPAGTNVSGTVTRSERSGRVKGRAQLSIRLEQMVLPNGVSRDLLGRPSALDGRSNDSFNRETRTVTGPSTYGRDVSQVANMTMMGTWIGGAVGAAGLSYGTGASVGAAAGAAGGLASVLLTRGPDVSLDRGTHIEMMLTRNIHFSEGELQELGPGPGSRPEIGPGPGPPSNDHKRWEYLAPFGYPVAIWPPFL